MVLSDFDCKFGDCIFTYNGGWLNKKIMWFSKWRTPKDRIEKIAHVAFFIGYDEKRNPIIMEADWKGIVVHSGSKYNQKRYTIHIGYVNPKAGKVIDDENSRLKFNIYVSEASKNHYAYLQLVAIACKKILGLNRIG